MENFRILFMISVLFNIFLVFLFWDYISQSDEVIRVDGLELELSEQINEQTQDEVISLNKQTIQTEKSPDGNVQNPMQALVQQNLYTSDYKSSKLWQDYLTFMTPSDKHFFIPNNSYWQKRNEYLLSVKPEYESRGLPIKSQRNYLVELELNHPLRKVVDDVGTLSNPLFYKGRDQYATQQPKYMQYEIDIFFEFNMNKPIHKFHKIGRDFLWENQRYNRIWNLLPITHKEDFSLAYKSYRKNYMDRDVCLNSINFFPETYSLKNPDDCQATMEILQGIDDSVQWIFKVGRIHLGQGLNMVDKTQADDIMKLFDYGRAWGQDQNYKNQYFAEQSKTLNGWESTYMIQSYISNPLLLNGHKFDYRALMTIANTSPLLVLYHDRYARVASEKFDSELHDNSAHVTNTNVNIQSINEHSDEEIDRSEIIEDLIWSSRKVQAYLEEQGKVQPDWFENVVRPEFMRIQAHTMKIIDEWGLLMPHPGTFATMALDYVIDDNLNIYLIEVVDYPGWQPTYKEINELEYRDYLDLLDMQHALLIGNMDLFDAIVEKSEYRWVYDERRTTDPYFGLIEDECL